MEQINTYNYQAWFLDFIEGKLDAMQVKVLQEFLAQHPELAEELNEFENVELGKEKIVYDRKIYLKKGEILDSFIDEQCIAFIENDLNESEKNQFDQLLLSNPTSWRTLEVFKKTKLLPDSNIVFEKKQQLKHFEIGFDAKRLLRISSIAASIALLIGISLFFNKHENLTHPVQIAQKIETVTTKQNVEEAKPLKQLNSKVKVEKNKKVRRNESIKKLERKGVVELASLQNTLSIQKPLLKDEDLSMIASIDEETIQDTNSNADYEIAEKPLWAMITKGANFLYKYNLLNFGFKKEKDPSNKSTFYAFDTKWVSVYAYVNEE